MELDILRMMETFASYNKYSRYVIVDRLSPDIQDVFKELGNYYKESGATEMDWLSYCTWYVNIKHPSISFDKSSILTALTSRLHASKIATVPVNIAVLKNYLTRDYAAMVADQATRIAVEGHVSEVEALEELLHEYKTHMNSLEGEDKYKLSSDDIVEQLTTLASGDKYEWGLNELQWSLGSIKKGDFIIIGARPDGGKTTFLATQATHFAQQLPEGQCVLWLNNEEALNKVRARQLQAALNWTYEELVLDLEVTKKVYSKEMGGLKKIITYDNTTMSINDIDEVIARVKPSIIIIDQIWKVSGFEKESSSEISRYGNLAKYVRDLAKIHGPVLATTQLDKDAEGIKYPSMNTLYNSKTAVQGEADAIIMIGRDPDEPPTVRFISTPKNKMTFGDPAKRNATWAIGIDPGRAQLISKVSRP